MSFPKYLHPFPIHSQTLESRYLNARAFCVKIIKLHTYIFHFKDEYRQLFGQNKTKTYFVLPSFFHTHTQNSLCSVNQGIHNIHTLDHIN